MASNNPGRPVLGFLLLGAVIAGVAYAGTAPTEAFIEQPSARMIGYTPPTVDQPQFGAEATRAAEVGRRAAIGD